MILNLISPCGGSYDDILLTFKSVFNVSSTLPNILFKHYLCYNNNLKPYGFQSYYQVNYEVNELDINPVKSRSSARNECLAQLRESNNSFVMFLDAGDLLEMDALSEIVENTNSFVSSEILFACHANIQGEKIVGIRKPKPKLKYFINPFYLGSVILATKLAIKSSFQEGRKEDWKYWLDILEYQPDIFFVEKTNYTYIVKSKSDHFQRKSKLILDQYFFFKNYLNMSVTKSLFHCFLFYTLVSLFWLLAIRKDKSIQKND